MVFVYMVSGFIEGYHLDDQQRAEMVLPVGVGRVTTQAVVSDGSIAWTTDKGFFYVADSDPPRSAAAHQKIQAEISSRPAHSAPYLYACSLNGFVYALNEETGQTVWKFPAGSSISKQPAAVKGQVYIVPDAGGMFCLDGDTGNVRWFATNIIQYCRGESVESLRPLIISTAWRFSMPSEGHASPRILTGRRADETAEPADRSHLSGFRPPESCSACTRSASQNRWSIRRRVSNKAPANPSNENAKKPRPTAIPQTRENRRGRPRARNRPMTIPKRPVMRATPARDRGSARDDKDAMPDKRRGPGRQG